MARPVTERDFRLPEFYDADPADYEFRADGKVVRKDRWERAIGSIRHLVGITGREFEISEVVEAVRKLAAQTEGWLAVEVGHPLPADELPEAGLSVEVRLVGGSVLRNAHYDTGTHCWVWNGVLVPIPVEAWREQRMSRPAEME